MCYKNNHGMLTNQVIYTVDKSLYEVNTDDLILIKVVKVDMWMCFKWVYPANMFKVIN